MNKYIYRFGYCTPIQWSSNQAHGWDDESSGAFVVCAEVAQDALCWGREVAGAFVAQLFEHSGCPEPKRWADAAFADWIDDNHSADFSEDEIRALPVVTFGEMPNFATWESR